MANNKSLRNASVFQSSGILATLIFFLYIFVIVVCYAIEINSLLTAFHETLQKNDYHASAGFCIGENGKTVKEIVKYAEKQMYEVKKQYYESIGKSVRNKIE